MDRTLWIYWENAPGTVQPPPHIRLCHRIMRARATQDGYALQLVTPENVRNYLPDLPTRLALIALLPRGRIEALFFRARRRNAAIALRADYIRAFLLERHGGIYIDSDAVVLGDIKPYFEEVERAGFLVTRRSSHGKTHASVGFYGSIAGGTVIREYAEALRRRLTGPLDYDWNEVGAAMLTPIVDRHADSVAVLNERQIQPVTFEEADVVFNRTDLNLDNVIHPETRVFMLYNGPFKGRLAGLDEDALCAGPKLVSQAFRRGLGLDAPRSGQGTSQRPAQA